MHAGELLDAPRAQSRDRVIVLHAPAGISTCRGPFRHDVVVVGDLTHDISGYVVVDG